jgi:hypothetical protein
MFRNDSSTIRAGGRVVGEVVERKFVKKAKGSRHMLREPKGWAVDVRSLDDARDLGAETVEIHDTETGIIYSAPIAQIMVKGFRFDRGFGAQICLPLQFWSVRHPGEGKDVAQQLSLAIL